MNDFTIVRNETGELGFELYVGRTKRPGIFVDKLTAEKAYSLEIPDSWMGAIAKKNELIYDEHLPQKGNVHISGGVAYMCIGDKVVHYSTYMSKQILKIASMLGKGYFHRKLKQYSLMVKKGESLKEVQAGLKSFPPKHKAYKACLTVANQMNLLTMIKSSDSV